MSFEPWNRDPTPCRQCKNIYDDTHGRLGRQMIPCLQAHRRSATGEVALLALPTTDIGSRCPFSCTLGELIPYAIRGGGINANAKAQEILIKIRDYAVKMPTGFSRFSMPTTAVTEGQFDIYDPRSYFRSIDSPPLPEGHYVVIKAENHEPLWNEFKPWYLANISATLNGWSLGEMMIRVLNTACANAGAELKAMSREVCTPANAAQFAVFVVVMIGLQASGPGRVLAWLLGAYFTLDMIMNLAKLLLETGRIFLNATTEADLDRAGMMLAKFFAQLVIYAATMAAAGILAIFLKGVLGAAVKQIETAAKKNQPVVIEPNARVELADTRVPTKKPLPLWKDKMDPEAAKVANGKKGPAFYDAPQTFEGKSPNQIRIWLRKNGFSLVKKAEVSRAPNGMKRTDSSEIWYRSRPVKIQGSNVDRAGKIEAVRLDEWGHDTNPTFAGARSHVHTDLIDYADSQTYLNIFVPELPVAYRAGAPVPKYTTNDPFNGARPGKQDPTNPTYFPDTHQPIRKVRR